MSDLIPHQGGMPAIFGTRNDTDDKLVVDHMVKMGQIPQ